MTYLSNFWHVEALFEPEMMILRQCLFQVKLGHFPLLVHTIPAVARNDPTFCEMLADPYLCRPLVTLLLVPRRWQLKLMLCESRSPHSDSGTFGVCNFSLSTPEKPRIMPLRPRLGTSPFTIYDVCVCVWKKSLSSRKYNCVPQRWWLRKESLLHFNSSGISLFERSLIRCPTPPDLNGGRALLYCVIPQEYSPLRVFDAVEKLRFGLNNQKKISANLEAMLEQTNIWRYRISFSYDKI